MLIVQETHQIQAGSQFDGDLPSTDHDLEEGDLIYAPDTKGGEFLLPIDRAASDKSLTSAESSHSVRRVIGVRVKFGGQSSWTLKIVNVRGDEITWLSGTSEASLVVTDQIYLSPSDWLKLETVGASTAMSATVAFEIARRTQS